MPQGPTAACPKSDTFGGRDQKGSPRLRGINSIFSLNKVKTACVTKVPMIFFPTCQVRVVRLYIPPPPPPPPPLPRPPPPRPPLATK